MQCVLQFPTVEMITQKETRGEFYLHKLFNSFPCFSSHILCCDASYSHSDSPLTLPRTFSDQLSDVNHVIVPLSLSWTSRAPRGCVGEHTRSVEIQNPEERWQLHAADKSKWPATLRFLKLSKNEYDNALELFDWRNEVTKTSQN